ncbi:MAG: aminoglycoside phosphotransferase family protein [Phycisphaerales bacterium]|nr:aminoglycoside phosphotransferase family protein [Phycisphaerales bacterium]
MHHDPTLAHNLLPTLLEACDGHLGDVSWFRADWQRGGASTGRSVWKVDGTADREVVVKFPVVPRELYWTRRLQSPDGEPPSSVPHLFASGSTLGNYDLAWIVIERLPHGPLGLRWHQDHIARVADAAARFYLETDSLPVLDAEAKYEDWETLLETARASLRDNRVPNRAEWIEAVKRVQRLHDSLVEAWRARDTTHWVHGDLHLANAMSRDSAQSGDVILIDLAEIRPGHWTEDAVYLERQLWGRPDRLKESAPVRTMAKARRKHGLSTEAEATKLADIRRVLMASTAPAFLRTEGHPRHLSGALQQLNLALKRVTAG